MNNVSRKFEVVQASAQWNGREQLFNWQPFEATQDWSGFVRRYSISSSVIFISFWRPEWEGEEEFLVAAPVLDDDDILMLAPANWDEVDFEDGTAWLQRARQHVEKGWWGCLSQGENDGPDFYAADGQVFHEPVPPLMGCTFYGADWFEELREPRPPRNWRWASAEDAVEILGTTPKAHPHSLTHYENLGMEKVCQWLDLTTAQKRAFLPPVELEIERELIRLVTWMWASAPVWRSPRASEEAQQLSQDSDFWHRTRFMIQKPDASKPFDFGGLFTSNNEAVNHTSSLLHRLWPHIVRGLESQLAELDELAIELENHHIMFFRTYCAYKVCFEPPTFHEAMDAIFALQEWLAERADFHEKLE